MTWSRVITSSTKPPALVPEGCFAALRRSRHPGCEFLPKINAVANFPEMEPMPQQGIPPPPSVYWNHWVSGKLMKNLWGTITCGQNLHIKELTCPDRGDKSQDGTKCDPQHRHGLGDDR